MGSLWQDLIGNLAVVILFIFAWVEGQRWLERHSERMRQVLFALWFGLGAIATMLLAVKLESGVYVDLRVSVVALAGFFGGPLAGLIAGGVAGATRLALGGSGALPGVLMILLAVLGSLLAGRMFRRAQHPERAMLLLALAAAIAASSVMAFIPLASWPTVLSTYVVPLALTNAATALAAAFFTFRAERYRNEQHLLRSAVAQAPDFLYVKDLNSRFVAVNAAVATFNEFADPREMIGKSDFDLNKHDRARRLFLAEQAMMHGGKPVLEQEEYLPTPGGETRWFVTSKSPLRDLRGNTVGLVGVTRDVTRFRQLEDDLRASRDLLSHALAEMSDGVAMFDAEGRLTFCNERYRTTFPLTSEVRTVGTPLRDILAAVVRTGEQIGAPQTDADGWIATVLGSLRSGGEEQVQLFDGRWLHVRTRVASDGGAMVVVSEVTAIKQAETQLRGLTESLRTLASTDALTGLPNRRAFDQALKFEISRSRDAGTPLSLLMVDVDHFKKYNDLYGHPAGDACLQRIAECLARATRGAGDLAARYGGEEFALILRDASEPDARRVAQRLMDLIAQSALPHDGNRRGLVTVSLGLSVLISGESGEDMLRRADTALYAAKAGGRNQVMAWGPDDQSEAKAVLN